jgi:hypothetical protein
MRQMRVWIAVLITGVVILSGALVVTNDRAESSAIDQVGRYQIACGYYQNTTDESRLEKPETFTTRPGVFKVDTVTGQCWVYSEKVDTESIIEDRHTRTWILID